MYRHNPNTIHHKTKIIMAGGAGSCILGTLKWWSMWAGRKSEGYGKDVLNWKGDWASHLG